MANETLNLNETISDEEHNPTKALNPTDISISKPDCPESTSNPDKSSSGVSTGAGKEGDTLKNKNGASAGVPVGSLAGDNEPVSHVQKKIRRAERFGMPVKLTEEEKRNTRAERFGTFPALHGSDGSKKSEEAKRKARAERFGLILPSKTSGEETKKKRLDKFALVSKTDAPNALEADKRKARAIRFSNPSSGSLSQDNGKGDTEQKADVVDKASGGA